jgi:hypothetical protein
LVGTLDQVFREEWGRVLATLIGFLGELDRALALRGRGPYVLQAAIASLHAEAPCDWVQIAALHGELTRLTGSPVVELNRAIPIAETEGPEAGLRIVDELGLDDFRYLHSTRAELLRRLGRTDEARDAYRRAAQANSPRRSGVNGLGLHMRNLRGCPQGGPPPHRACCGAGQRSERRASRPVGRVLCTRVRRADGHPSGTAVAGSLVRSTREHRAGHPQALAQARAPKNAKPL